MARRKHSNTNLISYLSTMRDENLLYADFFVLGEANRIAAADNSHIDMPTYILFRDMDLIEFVVDIRIGYDLDVALEILKSPCLAAAMLMNMKVIPEVVVADLLSYFNDGTHPAHGDYDIGAVWNVLFTESNNPLYKLTLHAKNLDIDTDHRINIMECFLENGMVNGLLQISPDKYSSGIDVVLNRLISGTASVGASYIYVLHGMLKKYKDIPSETLEHALYSDFSRNGSTISNAIKSLCVSRLCKVYDAETICSKIVEDSRTSSQWAIKGASALPDSAVISMIDHRSAKVRSIAISELGSREVVLPSDMIDRGLTSSSITERSAWMRYASRISSAAMGDGAGYDLDTQDTDGVYPSI